MASIADKVGNFSKGNKQGNDPVVEEIVQETFQQTYQEPVFDYGYAVPPEGGFSFTSRRSGGLALDSVIGANGGGAKYEELYNQAVAAVNLANERSQLIEYGVHRFTKGDWKINYSGVIISGLITQENGVRIVGYNVIMVQSTGEDPGVRFVNNHKEFPIQQPAAQGLDDFYMNEVRLLLTGTYQVDPNSILVAGGVVLPREFTTSDETLTLNFLSDVMDSVKAEMYAKLYGETGGSLEDFMMVDGNGFGIQASFNTSNSVHYDSTMMPIRNDIELRLVARSKSQNHNSINEGNSVEPLLDLYGYIDFKYTQPQFKLNPMMAAFSGMGRQCLIPEFVITDIKPAAGNLLTENMVWMAVTQVFALSRDYAWAQGFLARAIGSVSKSADLDYNDICNLNVIANLEDNPTGFGSPLNRNSKEYSTATVQNLIRNAVFSPGISIAIDIPEASVSSSVLRVLKSAKANDPRAVHRVNSSLNRLTRGRFGMFNGKIFDDLETLIYGGYYKVGTQMYDVRRLTSLLGVTAHILATNQDPNMIYRFINTMQSDSIAPDFRASEQYKFLDAMANQTQQLKQWNTRLTFSKPFLEYMRTVMVDSGFKPTNDNLYGEQDIFAQRSFDYANTLVSGGFGSNAGMDYGHGGSIRDYGKSW